MKSAATTPPPGTADTYASSVGSIMSAGATSCGSRARVPRSPARRAWLWKLHSVASPCHEGRSRLGRRTLPAPTCVLLDTSIPHTMPHRFERSHDRRGQGHRSLFLSLRAASPSIWAPYPLLVSACYRRNLWMHKWPGSVYCPPATLPALGSVQGGFLLRAFAPRRKGVQ